MAEGTQSLTEQATKMLATLSQMMVADARDIQAVAASAQSASADDLLRLLTQAGAAAAALPVARDGDVIPAAHHNTMRDALMALVRAVTIIGTWAAHDQVGKVRTFDITILNAGVNTAGNWTVNYAGEFAERPAAVVPVCRGINFWGDTTPRTGRSSANVGAIPQNVWIDVDDWDISQARGNAYVSESQPAWEVDNLMYATIVVIGRAPVAA